LVRLSSFNKRKIINDPVYGFIAIPNELVFDIIEHPYFQRLRRIKQLGLTDLVYPGALHTRFHHSLGAMHLMRQAIEKLRFKGKHITDEEANGVTLAILLHDIGHTPFSHTLEKQIIFDINHEEITDQFIRYFDELFKGELSVALEISRNAYPKTFLHQLVSSQLDMDRLDFLKRDSFYTGVSEGVINTERIIDMLDVVNDELVVEAKGIYSIENFIVARRLMYWQVYLHKTVMAAEKILLKILERARLLSKMHIDLFATSTFAKFLNSTYTQHDFAYNKSLLASFAGLDDMDIMTSIKVWSSHNDKILSTLCRSLTQRHLFRMEMQRMPYDEGYINRLKEQVCKDYKIEKEESDYFVITGMVENSAYNPSSDKINIYYKDGKIVDIAEASDQLNVAVLSKPVTKFFLCYPKTLTRAQ
jgi:HD superfamily phosphohydrolase